MSGNGVESVEVRLFASLRENREKTLQVQWHEGMDGNTLLATLGIPTGDVAIFLVDGQHSKADVLLKEEDVIALFPPVGGG